jgi:hypothetical protein
MLKMKTLAQGFQYESGTLVAFMQRKGLIAALLQRRKAVWGGGGYVVYTAVLRIRDVYPGSRIRLFSIPDPGSELSPSRIPDPHERI